MDPLWERLVVAATPALLTGLLAVLLVNRVTAQAQARRDDRETRDRLVRQMTETAQRLYIAGQVFWRAAREIQRNERRSDRTLRRQIVALDAAYSDFSVQSAIIEAELGDYFRGDACRRKWHQVGDLLAVRYFALTADSDAGLDRFYEKNAAGENGAFHSGLTIGCLKDEETLLVAYVKALPAACTLVRSSERARSDRSARA